jgi:hypothetical protein
MAFEKDCAISLNAYLHIYPDSFFGRQLKAKDIRNAGNALVFVGFGMIVPLAKNKKDYFVILKLIQRDVEDFFCMLASGDKKILACKFSDIKKTVDEKMLEKFEKYYGEEEKKLR